MMGGGGGVYLPARKTHFSDCTLPLDMHGAFIIVFQFSKTSKPNPGTWVPGVLIMHKKKALWRICCRIDSPWLRQACTVLNIHSAALAPRFSFRLQLLRGRLKAVAHRLPEFFLV